MARQDNHNFGTLGEHSSQSKAFVFKTQHAQKQRIWDEESNNTSQSGTFWLPMTTSREMRQIQGLLPSRSLNHGPYANHGAGIFTIIYLHKIPPKLPSFVGK